MGSDSSKSVVNRNCQTHDVRNLFVADGAPFVSQPDKNPTWTILALSWRTSDFIAQQRRSGAI
jgi:choline dehydrogenase-like flavoprotein